jgi:DNA-binding CsgD family transcriptional regulator
MLGLARTEDAMMRLLRVYLVLVGVFLLLTVMDMINQPAWQGWRDLGFDTIERLLLLAAMAGTAWAVQHVRTLQEDQRLLRDDVARNAARGEEWRAVRAAEIAALGRAIEDQFRLWHLTEAEIDVAGLMLKGASLKDIAQARDTVEATIRQQAQSIYRKSGLSGRAELSAYFLESLFETADDLAEAEATRGPRLVVAPVSGGTSGR